MSIIHNNLQALQYANAPLATLLSHLHENKIYEIFLSENSNEKNLNYIDTRDNTPLYNASPSMEISSQLKEFKQYSFYPILYFFGIGNGYFYKELLKNPKHQSLIIIEPELELLYITLNFVDFSEEIFAKKVIINHASQIDQNYCIALLNDRSKFFLKVYDLHVHSDYYEKFFSEIKTVHQSFINAFKYHTYTMGNSGIDGIIGLEHSLQNTTLMFEKPTLEELRTKGANSNTAVIVSTGPSLAKQLALLKKIQEYVTILCIDASFPILSKEGIKPDIVFSIERVVETSYFYEKTDKKYHKDVIFALASVVHPKTIENIHGEITFFLRSDSYNMYFELDKWGYLGGGMSAANFAYDFATKSNFDQIVIIGQDLAYGEDGSSHTKNHIFGEDEIKHDDIYCNIEAYGGTDLVPTTKIWKTFLDSYILQIELSSITTINATEGGARIKGTIEKSFQDVCQDILKNKKKKKKITLQRLLEKEKNIIKENYHTKLQDAITIGEKVYKKAQKTYKKADIFLKKVENYNDDMLSKVSFKELSIYVENITKLKEAYNNKKFNQMYTLLLQAYVLSMEFDVAEVYVMHENNELSKKKKQIAWIKIHQEWISRIDENLGEVIKKLKDAEEKISDKIMVA